MITEDNLKKHWLNKRIISISNGFETDPQDVSIKIGTIVDIIPISKSNTPTPVVHFDNEEELKLCLSTLLEFDQKLYEILLRLTAKERWLLIQSFVGRFSAWFNLNTSF